MTRTGTGPAAELQRRMCVCCGYRGIGIESRRGAVVLNCPCCGADLYARPPRSYAEMEGLVAPDGECDAEGLGARAVVRGPVVRAARGSGWARRHVERLILLSLAGLLVLLAGAAFLAEIGG